MKRILLVSASPRKGGNSERVVDYLAQALEGSGSSVSVQVFRVREQSVNYCLACDACQRRQDQACVQKDDMAQLLPQIEAADGIVLAAPIYNQMLSAQAVAFIDRFYPFFKEGDALWSNSQRREKKAAVVAVSWGTSKAYARLAEEVASGFCQVGASQTRGLGFGGIKERGELNDHPDYLERLDDLAEWIVS